MPSIKDFDKKKKKHLKKNGNMSAGQSANHLAGIEANELAQQKSVFVKESGAKKTQKRRPSQMESDAVEPVVEVAEAANKEEIEKEETEKEETTARPESFQSFTDAPKFELNFPFSFIVKSKVPKTFDLAEKIAGDWINDGSFESLPVGHPLAQILAATALTRAKRIEKKVLNSTPVTLAKIGLEYAKSKIKR